jgi:porphobilinogen synthase
MFLLDGVGQRVPVASLPGVERFSIDVAVAQAKRAQDAGIPAVALFPCIDPSLKTDDAREAINPHSLAVRAIGAIKAACPNLGVMCDVALDLYTSHGHDGLLIDGVVANDATVAVLVQQALCYADAGVDMVGPSDMMDGRVGAIRQALEAAGHHHTKIVAYSAKYDSGLYGPYRDAVGSKANLGKSPKSTYQQDPANRGEALLEASLDISEGADVLMVKPGLYYLDVIQTIKQQFGLPTWAYMVSGEYAMIQAAAQNGWIDGDRVMREAITCLKRAGADAVLTYGALQLAESLP